MAELLTEEGYELGIAALKIVDTNGNVVLTLPTSDGTSGQVITTDGSGALTFGDAEAATVTLTDESSDTTCFPVFTGTATGARSIHTGTNLTFNSSTGMLTTTGVTATTLTVSGNTTITGTLAVGYEAAAGSNSIAFGYSASASGSHATAIGYDVTASGSHSVAIGYNGTVSGNHSALISLDTTARTLSEGATLAIMGGDVGIGVIDPDCKLEVGGTDAMSVPSGTTAQHPGTPRNGMIRYNTTLSKMECYVDGGWHTFDTTAE